jgi:hypothetical protein
MCKYQYCIGYALFVVYIYICFVLSQVSARLATAFWFSVATENCLVSFQCLLPYVSKINHLFTNVSRISTHIYHRKNLAEYWDFANTGTF